MFTGIDQGDLKMANGKKKPGENCFSVSLDLTK